jgi:chromosome segregation ATPase
MTTTEQRVRDLGELRAETQSARANRTASSATVGHLVNERDRLQAIIAQNQADLEMIQTVLDTAEVELAAAERNEEQAERCLDSIEKAQLENAGITGVGAWLRIQRAAART